MCHDIGVLKTSNTTPTLEIDDDLSRSRISVTVALSMHITKAWLNNFLDGEETHL
jgi:hypothetical protein